MHLVSVSYSLAVSVVEESNGMEWMWWWEGG